MADARPPQSSSLPPAPRDEVCTVGIFAGTATWSIEQLLHQHKARVVMLTPGRPVFEQISGVDALVIPGGSDVHPSLYGEEVKGAFCGTQPSTADKFEIACIQEGYRELMPMLGICRGLQLMNVAAHGTLIQDIPSSVPQSVGHRGGRHTITLEADSNLAQVLGPEPLSVNSLHHQSVKDIGQYFRVAARASDGVVEAIESTDNPTQIAVQFHPEMMREARTDELFDFIVKCGEHYKTRRCNCT
jgi:putative glutamine amidotransferase